MDVEWSSSLSISHLSFLISGFNLEVQHIAIQFAFHTWLSGSAPPTKTHQNRKQ
jgi:hypothetical protein